MCGLRCNSLSFRWEGRQLVNSVVCMRETKFPSIRVLTLEWGRHSLLSKYDIPFCGFLFPSWIVAEAEGELALMVSRMP